MGFSPSPAGVPEPDQPVTVEFVSGGQIAIITLARPHADNAVTTELAARLSEILDTIAARTSVRVAIMTGAGDRAFCVGGDLRQRKDMTKEDWLRQRQVFDDVLFKLRQLRTPIIAAVNGLAIGGGFEMAQSMDFIIAADNAFFGQPEAMVGLSAGGGSPALLPRLVPMGKALQMLMTGEGISAQEAYRLGLVNEVHPRSDLMAAVLGIAEKIASNSPTAVQSVKRAVRLGSGEPIEQAIGIMMEQHWRATVHPDRLDGIRAFMESREPDFQDPDF
jgi:enoyl-CoA hydratase